MRHWWRLLIAGLAAVLVVVVGVVWPAAGRTALTPLDQTVRAHERLHFAIHLAAGRVFSICPCTRGLAREQYWKASMHAPTSMEEALVTSGRPQRVRDGPGDLLVLTRYGGWVARHSPGARRTLASIGIAVVAAEVMLWFRYGWPRTAAG
jgi:hypothetical protein